jgi:hypothetical protein
MHGAEDLLGYFHDSWPHGRLHSSALVGTGRYHSDFLRQLVGRLSQRLVLKYAGRGRQSLGFVASQEVPKRVRHCDRLANGEEMAGVQNDQLRVGQQFAGASGKSFGDGLVFRSKEAHQCLRVTAASSQRRNRRLAGTWTRSEAYRFAQGSQDRPWTAQYTPPPHGARIRPENRNWSL